MKKYIAVIALLLLPSLSIGQPLFKIGWDTYKAGSITHEYTYSYTNSRDSVHLFLTDSAQLIATADSLITLYTDYPFHEKTLYKTAIFLNSKKQIVKCADYRDNNLQKLKENKYDDKCRKLITTEENKINNNSYKETYEYLTEKNGDQVVSECSYVNGRVEFYTKYYYDKKAVKYKEVRLNDNNKDVVHIETYKYADNGKLKERSVYFPEFKVTKKFEEDAGDQPTKCNRSMYLKTSEKIAINTRVAFLKKFIVQNQALLSDAECHNFEYKFSNNINCVVIISTTKVNNGRQVIFRFKEKV